MTARASRKSGNPTVRKADPRDPLALSKVMPHHRVAWRVERIGWTAMALAIVAALVGVFGGGPLSSVHAGGGGLAIEYQRFQRSSAENDYRFDLDAALVRDGRLRLRLDQALLDDMELDSIIPEPEAVIAGNDHTEFVFLAAPGNGQARVVFRFRPATFGRRAGRVEVPGAPPVVIDQFIYP